MRVVNMTMAVPPKLHERMRKHRDIKWAEVARQAFEKKVRELEGEKKALRAYAYKRLVEEGDDAEKLFKL